MSPSPVNSGLTCRLRQPPARSCYHLLRIAPVPPSPPCTIRPSLTSVPSVIVPSSSRPLLCDAQSAERSHSATWHAGCYSLVDLSGRPSEVGSGGPRPRAACCPSVGQQAASKTGGIEDRRHRRQAASKTGDVMKTADVMKAAGVSATQPAQTRRVPTRPITRAQCSRRAAGLLACWPAGPLARWPSPAGTYFPATAKRAHTQEDAGRVFRVVSKGAQTSWYSSPRFPT